MSQQPADHPPFKPEEVQWRCSHCHVWLSLLDGRQHIDELHGDCLSCSAESLLLMAMWEGRGWITITRTPLP